MPVRQVWSHLQQKCSYYLQITSWPALFYFHTLEAILQAQWTHCKTIHFPLLPLYSLFFSFIYLYIHSFIWLHWALVEACWIFRCGMWDLVPWPGIEAGTPALEAQSLSHWTTREHLPFWSFLNVQLSGTKYIHIIVPPSLEFILHSILETCSHQTITSHSSLPPALGNHYSTFCLIPWRGNWQPTPVLLPGKFHGLRSLVGYNPRGCKESDMTVLLHLFN